MYICLYVCVHIHTLRKSFSVSTLLRGLNCASSAAYVNRFAVWRAVIQWQKYTCLKFREVSPTYSGPHLRIQRHADDCKSYVGVISSSGQDFYISEDCERHVGTLVLYLNARTLCSCA